MEDTEQDKQKPTVATTRATCYLLLGHISLEVCPCTPASMRSVLYRIVYQVSGAQRAVARVVRESPLEYRSPNRTSICIC